MTQERPSTPPPSRPGGKNESWRVERMVQRVPAHLGETTTESISPWVMVAGVILLLLVVCAVIFFLLGGTSRFFGAASATATPTRARTPLEQPITILPVLATPVPTTPAPTPVTTKYKVKQGDNLIEIAARFKVSVQAIKAANGMQDDTIRIGQELTIPLPTPTPPPGSKPPAGTPTPISFESPPTSASPAAPPGVVVYTVQRGDTLISIAATYGSTVDAIRIANQLDSDFLSIGQILNVPVGSWTPTPTMTNIPLTTATPTAPFAYAAPNLLSPSDNQTFRGSKDVPTLAWTAPATLKPNEFYVLNLSTGSGAAKKSWSLQIRQGTSKTLDATYYPGANPSGTRFSWYVVIVNQPTSSRSPTITSAPIFAASPPTETRTFVWY